ncbi:hypothetical protein NW762_004836 [Fusarium torreyae]|uniref:Uncharacterized protein n=1 Tax=Fusarium torreyae TaxID=1237075 RepID=A0A9W8S7M8_9HYPO|nr:hypothetical protein NW762_004836 [Fusarium torreyae]
MSLLSLPLELIPEIAGYLITSDVESLVRTFSKRLYQLCIPRLAKKIVARKNAKRMIEIFGQPRFNSRLDAFDGYVPDEDIAQFLGFLPGDKLRWLQGPPNFDYPDLNGDLSFLEDNKGFPDHGPAIESIAHIESIVTGAERLGLVLPDGFVKLMSDVNLQALISTRLVAHFTLGEIIRKCPAEVDKGAGGYLVTIAREEDPKLEWCLYLCPGEGGGHCMLRVTTTIDADRHLKAKILLITETATQEEIERAQEEGFPLAYILEDSMRLEGTSFEEFVATIYHKQLTYFMIDEGGAEVTSSLREYLRRHYLM